MKNSYSQFLIIVGLILGLSACGIYPLQVTIRTSSVLNLDKNYHALPVKIRVYQLKNSDEFKQASFQELWLHSKSILSESLVKSSSFTINPAENKIIRMQYDPSANYIAVVAIFRKPQYKQWRAIKKIDTKVPIILKHVSVSVFSNRITIK